MPTPVLIPMFQQLARGATAVEFLAAPTRLSLFSLVFVLQITSPTGSCLPARVLVELIIFPLERLQIQENWILDLVLHNIGGDGLCIHSSLVVIGTYSLEILCRG
jgi:hypothetical protein